MTTLEAESAVASLLAGKRDEAKHDAAAAAAELADVGPRMERVAAELESLAKRRESLRETRARCEALAAAYQAAIDRYTPAAIPSESASASAKTPADSPAPDLFRPFVSVPSPVAPPAESPATTPARAVTLDPRETCANCGARVLWDEQNGFSHAEDGTPAGGLCERRWAA
ncbi:hypothetical protein ITP53_11475 [Nonomuraea sp. K274]|uniref:Uncharacterized protein n=1 Tax=Nonomuraea cypriaca TaxID=1187855 RepID=A0A931AA83_9ACTN|nr:hypothetical protein [Nonomuraea cypriaca]MBF8186359.1 hypothetical protein [Nonomuraea cypriaca]